MLGDTITLRDKWDGLYGIWRAQPLPKKHLLILGEHHIAKTELENARVLESPDHAIYGLTEYLQAAADRNETVTVYAELSYENEKFKEQYIKMFNRPTPDLFRPTFSMIERFFHQDIMANIPSNVAVKYCNIRHSAPFSLLMMTYSPDNFEIVYNLEMKIKYEREDQRKAFIKRQVRRFEKAFTENIHNSFETIQFWRSLVFPDVPLQEWYGEIVEELYANHTVNYVKNILSVVKEKHPTDYVLLMNMYNSILETYFTGHKLHTVALAKIQRRVKRYSKMTPALMRDHKKIGNYFGVMLEWIQDLYALARYILCRSLSNHHVFLVGFSHTQFLTWFLSEKEQISFKGWMLNTADTLSISTRTLAPISGNFEFYEMKEYLEKYIADPSPALAEK